MIVVETKGNFKRTEKFLDLMSKSEIYSSLEKYAREGLAALVSATPQDSGETAAAWSYEVKVTRTSASISWTNSHIVNGVPIAIILQYGHGTRNGGYVQGRDYINPALRPVFDRIADDVWKKVTSA